MYSLSECTRVRRSARASQRGSDQHRAGQGLAARGQPVHDGQLAHQGQPAAAGALQPHTAAL